jgi:hypothetical protein
MARKKTDDKFKIQPSDEEVQWIAGRNTEITKNFSDLRVLEGKINEYFDDCKTGGLPPTIEGMCLKLRICESTFYRYLRGEHKIISDEMKQGIIMILEEAYLKIKNFRVTQISTNASNRNVEGNKFLLKNMTDNVGGKQYQEKVINENHEFTINVGLEEDEETENID